MLSTLFKFTICLSVLSMAGVAFAQQQEPPAGSRGSVSVEFADNDVVGDLQSPIGGGPLSADPGQVLYTEPVDGIGPSWPFDSVDYYITSEQIDALACVGDAYFSSVINDNADLLVSFLNDEGVNREAVYIEKQVTGVTGKIWDQTDLYAENNDPPPGLQIEDLDALELWGPFSDGVDPKSGWDANCHSIIGDAAGVTSVFYNDPPVAYIPHADIVAAVVALGFSGLSTDVDLDALMCRDGGNYGVWDDGDKILFSIRAAGNWDGGELVVLERGAAPSFLSHGGHLWNTAFDIQTAFSAQTEEIDAIEAVGDWEPEEPEPDEFPELHLNNPDITNLGPPAHDITIVLKGAHTILWHYNGLRFQEFETTLVGGNTKMRWYDPLIGPILTSETIHIGWATARATKVIDAYWTDAAGDRIPDSYIKLIKPVMRRLLDGTFVVTFENAFDPEIGTPEPITLTDLRYSVSPPWELEVLNGANVELMASLLPLASSLTVEVGTPETLAIPEVVPFGDAVVLVYDIEASPFAVVTDYAQAVIAAPEVPDDIPAVSEWGLIVLVLLMMTAGLVVIGRRRRLSAA